MLKAVDVESSVSVVWHKDPAVVGPPEDGDYVSKCSENPGCWRDELVMLEGARPTEWILGVIPPAEMTAIMDSKLGQSTLWRCFLHSVRDIKNGDGLAPQGDPKNIPRVEINGVSYVSPEWLARTMARGLRECAVFLGGVAMRWNQLSEDDGKN